MKALQILVVEDDLLIATEIKIHLEKAGHSVMGPTGDINTALRMLARQTPDVALIDIQLNKSPLAGILFAQDVLAFQNIPFLYLTSSTDQETIEKAGGTSPAAYLLKPYREQELLIQIALAHENHSRHNAPHEAEGSLYIPYNKGHELILLNEVLFLEAKGAYVNVHTLSHEAPILLSMHLGSLSKHFTKSNFFRLSRSFIINLNHLKRIQHDTIQMGERRTLVKISDSNRKMLLERLKVIRTK